MSALPNAVAQAQEKFVHATGMGKILAMLELGGVYYDHNMQAEADALRTQMIGMLVKSIQQGDAVDLALLIEMELYNNIVKKVENETFVRDCFQTWIAPLAALGRRYRSAELPRPLHRPTAELPWRAGFVLPTSTLLGHTEALLEVLRHRPHGMPWHDRPVVFVLDAGTTGLAARCGAVGADLVSLEHETPEDKRGTPSGRQLQLRQAVAARGVTHLVTVSVPTVGFLHAARVAPVQLHWTLKFHPFQIPDIDGYISYGSWWEDVRIEHGEPWQVVPLMLDRPSAAVDAAEVTQKREAYAAYDIILGTLARTEKLNSPPYLAAVAKILRDNPQACFLWTGRAPHAGIQASFEQAGVADRCFFIGWVDTALYARVLDVFLESFPFGCGITAIQALAAGTPLLSYAAPETQHGMHFHRPLAAGGAGAEQIRALLQPRDGTGPLLYPADAEVYVALAGRLIREPDFRHAAGLAGQDYYRRYLTDSKRMGMRFFSVLADCKAPEAQTT